MYSWLRDVYDCIEAADNFVFIISPDSLDLKPGSMEITHAAKYRKRVVPLLYLEAVKVEIPEPISIHIN